MTRPPFVNDSALLTVSCLIRYDTVTACPQKEKKSIALDAETCLRKQLKTHCKLPAFPAYPRANRTMIKHWSEVEYCWKLPVRRREKKKKLSKTSSKNNWNLLYLRFRRSIEFTSTWPRKVNFSWVYLSINTREIYHLVCYILALCWAHIRCPMKRTFKKISLNSHDNLFHQMLVPTSIVSGPSAVTRVTSYY